MSSKKEALKLVSKYLKEISGEETELVADDEIGGVMITKAEHLARLMWKFALGFTQTIDNKEGEDTVIIFPPDKGMMNLLLDRLEGRVVPVVSKGDSGVSVSKRVTEQSKKRVNRIMDTDGN